MLNFFKKNKTNKASLFTPEPKKGRPQFHQLRVEEITRETEDTVSVAFAVPEAQSNDYHFLPGQYLTLETEIEGEKVRRSYSLCSSPFDGELRVAIKTLPGGSFSTYANRELKVGDELAVMTPQGNFALQIEPPQAHHYVAFAAGSGITPIFSMIKSVLEKEPESRFTLFYGNKTSKSVIFKEQLEALKNTHMKRLEIHYVLSREDQGSDLLKGRIDEDKCGQFAQRFFDPAKIDDFWLCGPEGMIREVSAKLESMGVAPSRIHFELFTSPAQSLEGKTSAGKSQAKEGKQGQIERAVTVILDGEETHFQLKEGGVSVLDAALDAGADVPFACKGAVCCTCRAKVLEGEVEMTMNYALEDDEVEEGYVLTCQTHPRSEKVVISYDD